MLEERKIDGSNKNSLRFPLKKAPESTDKFPFRDLKHYTNPEDDEVKTKRNSPRFGYVAQRSLNHLEATGRKPDLQNVPWFRAAGNSEKR